MGRPAKIAPDEFPGEALPEFPPALWAMLDAMPARREKELFRVFLEKRRVLPCDFSRLLGQDYAIGDVTSRIHYLRRMLAGAAWHIETLGRGRYELREGKDPMPRGSAERGLPPLGEKPQAGEVTALLQAVSGGQYRALLSAFCGRVRLSEDECLEILREISPAALRVERLIHGLRRELRPMGWYLYRVSPRNTPGIFELRRAASDARPVAAAPAPPVPARIIAGRRELRLPAAPGGCCQYMVVKEGKAVPCGAPAKGTYCAEHKAKSAGLERAGWSW